MMVDGADFYYKNALQVTDSSLKLKNLEQAIKICNKILSLDYEPKSVLSLTDIYLAKYDLTYNENELERIKDLQSDLLTKIKKDDLFEVLRYYFAKCEELDSIIIMLEFPQRLIDLAERTINFYPAGCYERTEISLLLSNLSYKFISSKEFDLSLKLILLSVKSDEKNDYAYTNLPLAYIFNGQYDEAINIYNEWKEKTWSEDSQFKTFKEVFLIDITELESQGVTHPDFAKVKELLKE
jgi:tetratricopeptide (TPR) repeat protein